MFRDVHRICAFVRIQILPHKIMVNRSLLLWVPSLTAKLSSLLQKYPARRMASSSNMNDKWSAQADLYTDQAVRVTELHASDLIAILKDDILQAKTILDIGCGTGAFAKAYVQQFPKGVPGQTLISSDLSEGMLQKARETILPNPDFQTKLVFQIEDGTTLDGIPDCSVDIVVSLFGVILIPDQDLTLKSVARVLKNDKNNVFANASWMFGVSDYLASQGFGVSVQDAFRVPNDMIDPDRTKGASFLKWATIKDVESLLGADTRNGLTCYPAIHNTVWDFDVLWTMMAKNPMSAIPDASDADVAKAKKALEEFVTRNGKHSLDERMMFSTASILTVARGFGIGEESVADS